MSKYIHKYKEYYNKLPYTFTFCFNNYQLTVCFIYNHTYFLHFSTFTQICNKSQTSYHFFCRYFNTCVLTWILSKHNHNAIIIPKKTLQIFSNIQSVFGVVYLFCCGIQKYFYSLYQCHVNSKQYSLLPLDGTTA